MKQKLKYVSFVVILALFMVALAPNYIGYAEALSAEGSSDEMTSPKKTSRRNTRTFNQSTTKSTSFRSVNAKIIGFEI